MERAAKRVVAQILGVAIEGAELVSVMIEHAEGEERMRLIRVASALMRAMRALEDAVDELERPVLQ